MGANAHGELWFLLKSRQVELLGGYGCISTWHFVCMVLGVWQCLVCMYRAWRLLMFAQTISKRSHYAVSRPLDVSFQVPGVTGGCMGVHGWACGNDSCCTDSLLCCGCMIESFFVCCAMVSSRVLSSVFSSFFFVLSYS